MPVLAAIAGSSSGGRFTPEKPILAHGTQTGDFIISNYDPSLIYNISVNSGTITRNGSVISLSNSDCICTIYASPPKGIILSSPATAERKSYTYSSGQNCVNNCQPNGGPSGPNSCWCGSLNPQGDLCCGGCYGQTCSSFNIKNATPSGYTDSYNEWWKVT